MRRGGGPAQLGRRPLIFLPSCRSFNHDKAPLRRLTTLCSLLARRRSCARSLICTCLPPSSSCGGCLRRRSGEGGRYQVGGIRLRRPCVGVEMYRPSSSRPGGWNVSPAEERSRRWQEPRRISTQAVGKFSAGDGTCTLPIVPASHLHGRVCSS